MEICCPRDFFNAISYTKVYRLSTYLILYRMSKTAANQYNNHIINQYENNVKITQNPERKD